MIGWWRLYWGGAGWVFGHLGGHQGKKPPVEREVEKQIGIRCLLLSSPPLLLHPVWWWWWSGGEKRPTLEKNVWKGHLGNMGTWSHLLWNLGQKVWVTEKEIGIGWDSLYQQIYIAFVVHLYTIGIAFVKYNFSYDLSLDCSSFVFVLYLWRSLRIAVMLLFKPLMLR